MKHILLLCFMTFIACTSTEKPSVTVEDWGTVDSQPVYLFTLTNSNGITAKFTNYGGTFIAFYTPDRDGIMESIVLGPATFDEMNRFPTPGNTIGRYANRISNAKFTLDGVEYTLAANNGKNHIHGGIRGFSRKVWEATTANDKRSATLTLVYHAADMEEGYPGNLKTIVDIVLNNDNELQIRYTATTDKATVLNLTNHAYFNLTGAKEDVRGHQVRIYADEYTPTDDEKIPTGEIVPVAGTPLDLRQWTTISDRLTELPAGFDNNFCVKATPGIPVLEAKFYDPKSGRLLQTFNTLPAAELYDPKSGRLLQTYTTEPAIQFYTAGRTFRGACFEAQHYPDSPNNPQFPTTILRPGETYTQVTVYKTGVK